MRSETFNKIKGPWKDPESITNFMFSVNRITSKNIQLCSYYFYGNLKRAAARTEGKTIPKN